MSFYQLNSLLINFTLSYQITAGEKITKEQQIYENHK